MSKLFPKSSKTSKIVNADHVYGHMMFPSFRRYIEEVLPVPVSFLPEDDNPDPDSGLLRDSCDSLASKPLSEWTSVVPNKSSRRYTGAPLSAYSTRSDFDISLSLAYFIAKTSTPGCHCEECVDRRGMALRAVTLTPEQTYTLLQQAFADLPPAAKARTRKVFKDKQSSAPFLPNRSRDISRSTTILQVLDLNQLEL